PLRYTRCSARRDRTGWRSRHIPGHKATVCDVDSSTVGPGDGNFAMSGKHAGRRIGRGTLVILVVVGVLVAGAVGTAVAAMSYDRSRADLILPGVSVDGVAVGGMTRAQAIAAIRPVADRALAATITIHAGKAT